ncbi:MAG TPA: ATP-binding cassette domain-containing protein [Gemmatimonadales bacterium]|nr:ATP-binding cassette domain-containing protein [Gemmatimonadales bacterium]
MSDEPLPLVYEGIPLGRMLAGRRGSDPAAVFSLEVQPHETVVVLGDEASGVDRLAAIALGLDPAPGGRALIFGTEIALLSRVRQLAFRRRVGYLPAGDGLLQNLSLRDNIRLPLRFGSDFQADDIEGRVDVILAQLRLRAVAQLRPAAATEEERRRAALGRALAFDPELVILDQPFDGLGERVAAELLEVARGGEVAEGGRRTVFITGQDLPAMLRPRVERLLRLGGLPAGARA